MSSRKLALTWRRLGARSWLPLLALVIGLVAFVELADPRIHLGARDIGALLIGTPDEHEIATGIYGMFEHRQMNYNIPAYGGVYPNLSFLLLKPVLKTSGLTERALLLGLRHLSLIFAVLTLALIFVVARFLTDSSLAGLIAALVSAASPEFQYWAVRIHPDMLLLFLLTLAQVALAWAILKRSQRALTWSFILMVCGFMTKIVGIFLLPWIVLVQIWLVITDGTERPFLRLWSFAWRGAVLFALVMFLTTPTLLVDSRAFFHGLSNTSRDATGAIVPESVKAHWLWLFFDVRLVGACSAAVFLGYAASFLPLVSRWIRRRELPTDPRDLRSAARLVPIAFACGYIVFLFLFIRNYQFRYVMPILPSIAFGVAACLAGAWEHLPKLDAWFQRRRPLWISSAPIAVFLLIFFFESPARVAQAGADTAWLTRQQSDPRVEVAGWLNEEVDPRARILYDYGVYVPIRFKNAAKMSGIYDTFVNERPQYLVVHDSQRRHHSDPKNARGDERAVDYFRQAVANLARLEKGQLHDFRLLRRFEKAGISVYFDPSAPVCSEFCGPSG